MIVAENVEVVRDADASAVPSRVRLPSQIFAIKVCSESPAYGNKVLKDIALIV